MSRKKPRVTAVLKNKIDDRISLGDIFENVSVIESVEVTEDNLTLSQLQFPLLICLTQDCNLNQDYNSVGIKTQRLFHILVAPVFKFESYLEGGYLGALREPSKKQKITDTAIQSIIKNETPRYHYINFGSDFSALIVDFLHFFTINRDSLYATKEHRIGSLEDLYKESISQRFAYYLSRIGLPDVESEERAS